MSKAAELAALIGSQTALSNRNLIINGAMQVAQRGTSETGITSSKYAGAPDRFFIGLTTAGTWTAAQSTDAPAGFSSSYKLDCTVADSSLAAGDLLVFQQAIEAQNLQHLKKGTSSAESVTVSFHVKSNKTGTYIAELYDADNTRQISQAYTISSANTWEKKTLTYAGDTTGALNNDNGIGLYLVLWLAAGSSYSSGTLSTSWTTVTNANRAVGVVNLADSTDNEWLITGVQLELGEQATPFEHRSFGDVLKQCERYYEKTYQYSTAPGTVAAYDGNQPIRINGLNNSGSEQKYLVIRLRTEKRASPTTTYYNEAGNTGRCTTYDAGGTPDNGINIGLSISGTAMQGFGPSNGTFSGISCFMEHDAEL
jgi:hypothetical protein